MARVIGKPCVWSAGELAAAAFIFAAALLLRVAGLGWGLPPAIPEVAASGIRGSYAIDEQKVLTNLALTDPARGDFNPRVYLWGTLHLELVLVALECAERLDYFRGPWRVAYRQMLPERFERVYIAGRLIGVAMALLTVWLAMLAGAELASRRAGLWAALFVALSPAHVLNSTQIRVDVTMTAMVLLTAWLGLRAQRQPRPAIFLALGLAAGLALTAKHSALLVVVTIIVAALWPQRFQPRMIGAVLAGIVAGVLIGEPYLLKMPHDIALEVKRAAVGVQQTPKEFLPPIPSLVAADALHFWRFSIGMPAGLLALAGLSTMLRRRSRADWLILAAIVAGVFSMIGMRWPLLRYQLPLIPFFALAAAVALERCGPRWRWPLGFAAAAVSLAASLAQVDYMLGPHPANRALVAVLKSVPPGATISRLMPELPPLDAAVYPLGPNPFLDDLSRDPPAWVLTADLPVRGYPAATRQLLAARYEQLAEFHSRRIFAWATLGERGAPHDWKYTHPVMVLYRRRSP